MIASSISLGECNYYLRTIATLINNQDSLLLGVHRISLAIKVIEIYDSRYDEYYIMAALPTLLINLSLAGAVYYFIPTANFEISSV